jgi:hypothetical protein
MATNEAAVLTLGNKQVIVDTSGTNPSIVSQGAVLDGNFVSGGSFHRSAFPVVKVSATRAIAFNADNSQSGPANVVRLNYTPGSGFVRTASVLIASSLAPDGIRGAFMFSDGSIGIYGDYEDVTLAKDIPFFAHVSVLES